jgi:hypothetical protein
VFFLQVGEQAEDASSTSLTMAYASRIVNNVQVVIKNVHVRYEDNVSIPGVCNALRAGAACAICSSALYTGIPSVILPCILVVYCSMNVPGNAAVEAVINRQRSCLENNHRC